ncbi:FHA domain-containing protein [Lachnospiraceae bacterium 45-W7]
MTEKKYLQCSIMFVLLCVLLFPVNTIGAPQGFLQGYEAKEGSLQMYCKAFQMDGEQPLAKQFHISLSGQELPVTEAAVFEDSGVPITFYCLADVSGSMNQEQIAQVQEVLVSVCEGLREQDNMVIGSLGNDLAASGFLTDKDEIRNAVGALRAGKEDTNLYAGIVKGIDALKTDNRVNEKRCLLILSDGGDDQKSGITKAEAEQAVENSNIPVYTIATLRSASDQKQLKSAKILGSFARLSVGGVHYAPLVDGIEAGSIGEDIWKHENRTVILEADTSGVLADKDVLLLRVAYTAGEKSIEDSMEILREDLKLAVQEEPQPKAEEKQDSAPEGETDAAKQKETQPTPVTTSKPSSFIKPVFIAACVGTAALVIAAAVFIFIRKKRSQSEKEEQKKEDASPSGEAEELFVNPAPQEERAEEIGPLMTEVRFTAIGYEQICFQLQMEENCIMTMGRDKRAQLILNPQDKRLSGIHCKIRCVENALNIWDVSKNGTFVNGVSVKKMGMAVVEDGQSVRMGSYEYRVAIIRKEEDGQ